MVSDAKPAADVVAESVAGDPPVDADGAQPDLATQIREAVTDTFNQLLGRHDDLVRDADEEDDVTEPVVAKGKTAEARAARGPTREQTVAEQTRDELARIRKQEREEDENASLRAEVEELKGKVAAVAEQPPAQYKRLTKTLWG